MIFSVFFHIKLLIKQCPSIKAHHNLVEVLNLNTFLIKASILFEKIFGGALIQAIHCIWLTSHIGKINGAFKLSIN